MNKSTSEPAQLKPVSRACRLSVLDLHELKQITVNIHRHNIPEVPNATPPPIIRKLEDPATLVVHYRMGEGRRPIFDREDIVVNQEFEERVICTSDSDIRRSSSTRRSPSKSYSPGRKRSRTRSVSKGRSSCSSRRRSPKSSYKSQKYLRNKSRTRSPSPSSRNSKNKVEKYREDSPASKYSRRYSPPLRPGEYRPPKYRKRSESPRNSKSSPERPVAGPSRSDKSPVKVAAGKASPRKPSRSPERKRSVSPRYESRRRSRSPRGMERDRRYSRSPKRYRSSERDLRRSRSPYKELRRRHSRTPEKYRRSGRRSPSPPRRVRSPYRGPRILQPQYKDGGLWIPDEFLERGMYPSFFGPAPGPRLPIGPPGFKQRPYLPMQDPFMPVLMRPRPPIVYNSLYKPRPIVTEVTATVTNSGNAEVASTSSSTIGDIATEGVTSAEPVKYESDKRVEENTSRSEEGKE